MVQISSLENFIRKSIWQLTRQGDIQKYIPKELHNGVVVGDCAVIRNKAKSYGITIRRSRLGKIIQPVHTQPTKQN